MGKYDLTPKDFQRAFDSQFACNAGALIHELSRVTKKIQKEGRGMGTDWINNHPIIRLYTAQLQHLTKDKNYIDAYNLCEDRKEKNHVPEILRRLSSSH